MLGTIDRTSQMLKLFTLETPEWGISELANVLGWSTSTTHDLASSLSEIGLLKQNVSRRYEIGWRVLELSQVVLGSSSLQAEARKGMEQLARKYDETILLGVLAGGKILFADKIAKKNALFNTVSTPDMRFHAHCIAAGKVAMAYSSEEVHDYIFREHGFEPMTHNSIQDSATLEQELSQVVKQGYAYDFEEAVLGLGCVAAPIFDYSGQMVASLTLAIPIRQFEQRMDEYRRAVINSANQVSRRLGHMIFTR